MIFAKKKIIIIPGRYIATQLAKMSIDPESIKLITADAF